MRIVDRLFLKDDEIERSKKIVSELKKMSSELPKIVADAEAAKEELWTHLEEARKYGIIGCSADRMKEIQSAIWNTEDKIKAPRKAYAERVSKLSEELSKLTAPVISDVNDLLKRELKETRASRKARYEDPIRGWVDTQHGGDFQIKGRIIRHNFTAVNKAYKLISDFSIPGDISIDLIVKEIQKLETAVNKIDIGKVEDEEFSEDRYNDLKEAGLL